MTAMDNTPPRTETPKASFCVVLPMYNEADNAEACIRGVSEFLSGLNTRTAILAVDDGSTDATPEILDRMQGEFPGLMIERHDPNRGYGAANKTGLARVLAEGFDYAVVMDSDGTQDPKFLSGFFAPMDAGIEMIKATRYSPGGRAIGVPLWRRFVSWAGNKLARFMLRLPLTDYTNGFRALSAELIGRIDCSESGFAVLIEEVCRAKKAGATFAEFPYTLTFRDMTGSTSKFIHSWPVYRRYLKYLFLR